MLISKAYATENIADTATEVVPVIGEAVSPVAGPSFMWNMGLIALMFALFYLLLIRPQQKRLKAQQAMLESLKVGDKVVTGGGLIGTITKLDEREVEVDLGSSKVTSLRYTLTAYTKQ